MSYFSPTIRYEYADESNISQPSSMYADPPLFKEEMSDESHFFLHSNNSNQSLPFPASTFVQAHDDENLQPPVAAFSPFAIGDTSQELHYSQPAPSSVDYFFWQSDEASSSSVCAEERRQMYEQHGGQKQMRRIENDKNTEQCQRNAHLPTMDDNNDQQPSMLRRMPLQSMENASLLKSSEFSSSEHFSACKKEPIEQSEVIAPKNRLGPPAHWRVEETEKRQKRSVKRAPLPRQTTYQIDEHGRQVVVVRNDDSYRSNDEDDERTESAERGVPPIARNGFVKPAYSYSCLIGLSLKNSDTGELTVSEIYAFLCYHFPYFREAPSGWKNSVRHNLSLNKCFQKIEIETPGSHGRKSCLWRMNPQKCAKMDQELRKWRDRDERRILDAMEMPQNLDDLQNGTMGMPPNMKPRRFSIAPSVVDESERGNVLHSSSAHSQQRPFVAHSSADPPKTDSPPLHNPFETSSLLTLDNQLPPLPRRSATSQCQNSTQNNASMVSIDRQRHSVHAQAARKLENLLQQKQISSDAATDEAAGYFGGFTLIVMATPSFASFCVGNSNFVEGCRVSVRPSGDGSADFGRLIAAFGLRLSSNRCSFDQLVCSNSQFLFASLDSNPDYPFALQIVFSILTLLLALIALAVNSTVAWIVLCHRVMRQRTTNRLVFNLAISDLSITVFNTVPLGLYNVFNRWLLPHWLCPLNQMFAVTPFCASVFTMVAISIDRYFAILYPLQRRPWGTNGNRCCALTICAIWTISLLFGAPALYVYDTVENAFLVRGREVLNSTRTICDVIPSKRGAFLLYNASLVLLQFLLPFAILIFTYGRIAHELCKKRTPENNPKESFLKAKRRMAKLFAILVFSFLLLWCPYELLFAVSSDLSVGWTPLRLKIVLNVIFLLAMSSTVVSPIVYYHMSERFRIGFRYAFRIFLPKSVRVAQDEYRQAFALCGPRISLVFHNFHKECIESRRRTCETTVASAKASLSLQLY
ncbi:hypothetical protein niasHS_003501 [Heterodera schachtii]|uniref:Uncharacterized protein n=1 Tax=Heterodera schachtii TaxID=97005 RepID=A0ABD2KGP0_HETSC